MSHESTRCETVQALLIEGYAGSSLPGAKIVADEHLTQCGTCRALAEFDSRLAKDLRGESWPSPSSSLAKSVCGKLSQRRRRRRRKWISGFATAAMVLAALALIAFLPSGELSVLEGHRAGPTQVAVDDFRELAGLFEPPPVDSLDLLSRQQNGYVAALNRIGKE